MSGGAGIGGPSDGGEGGLERSSSNVCSQTRAGTSPEHSIFAAALMLPSSSLAATAAAMEWSLLSVFLLLTERAGWSASKISSALECQLLKNSEVRFLMVDVKLWRMQPCLG